MVSGRRTGSDSGTDCDADCKHPPRQKQAGVSPYADAGDFVIVTNAEKMRLTGNKLENKCYYRHSGYPGGLKTRTAQEVLKKRPEDTHRAGGQGHAAQEPFGKKTY